MNHCLSGRLGLIICEDLLWQYPTVDLVESNNVDTIIFPTEWWDEYPHQLPHVAQASWAKALQVLIRAMVGKMSCTNSFVVKNNKQFRESEVILLFPNILKLRCLWSYFYHHFPVKDPGKFPKNTQDYVIGT